jgi:hypothetical protein
VIRPLIIVALCTAVLAAMGTPAQAQTVARGTYQLSVLGPTLSCADAKDHFAQFLKGRLDDDWAVLLGSGEFVHSSIHDGFRIKRLISSRA